MITVPRAECRELAQVFRSLSQSRCPDRPVEFEAGRSGLSIRAATPDTTVVRHWPGRRPDETLVVPLRVLDECGGPGDTPVVFRAASGGGTVEWTDRGRPVRRTCPAPVPGPPAIDRPARFSPATTGLLTALADARRVAAKSERATMPALSHLLLRGRGEIVATDSVQLLIQTGFAFPWTGDLQVQSSGVFAALAALRPSTVSVARTRTQVWIRADEWFVVATIAQGRYPDIDGLLRRLPEPTSQLVLGEPDAARVMKELRRSGRSADESITIDLKRPAIRIPGGAEWPLDATQRSGRGSSVVCGRMLLLTALDLGFRRLAVSGGSQPVVFRDASRTHVFLPITGGREVSPPRPVPRTPVLPKAGETREQSRPAAVRPPRVRRAIAPLNPSPPPGRWQRLWRSVRRLVRIRR